MVKIGLSNGLLLVFTTGLMAALEMAKSVAAEQPPRPNILWITSEDNGPELGCYGDTFADTPNIDALAARGMRYQNCWSNAPVCAPARTTIISGMFPTSLGAQHMRSEVPLPEDVKLYPQHFRELGYYCTNNSKTDYNLEVPEDLWDDSSGKAHWRKRKAGQPFFAVFNFTISHESKLRTRPHTAIHDAAQVKVPPYHPDTPEVRQDWAQYYDRVTEMDLEVGRILGQLKEDGLEESTIVFYYGDHGSGMPRGKRWLYQSGLRVPMIVHVPAAYQALVVDQYASGTVSERLVSFVDLAPTVLSLVGVWPPSYLQGQAFLGPHATESPQYIYGFRDRMDERYDMSRAIRDQRFMYIRNFYPHRPQGAYLDYMFQTPTTVVWKKLFDAGKLNAAQSVFWLPKPSEELFDLENDPYQVNNLADSSEHVDTLERMRSATKQWMLDVRDVGFIPEGELLEKSDRQAPYALGQDSERYDLDGIYSVADLATRPTAADLAQLLEFQTSPDSVKRFWVANGLLLRCMQAEESPGDAAAETVNEIVRKTRGMLSDPSAYVRVIAAEVLARFGNETDRSVAMTALIKAADARNGNALVALTALNSLDWSKPTREEIGDQLEGVPTNDLARSNRYGSYIPNLLQRIEAIVQ